MSRLIDKADRFRGSYLIGGMETDEHSALFCPGVNDRVPPGAWREYKGVAAFTQRLEDLVIGIGKNDFVLTRLLVGRVNAFGGHEYPASSFQFGDEQRILLSAGMGFKLIVKNISSEPAYFGCVLRYLDLTEPVQEKVGSIPRGLLMSEYDINAVLELIGKVVEQDVLPKGIDGRSVPSLVEEIVGQVSKTSRFARDQILTAWVCSLLHDKFGQEGGLEPTGN